MVTNTTKKQKPIDLSEYAEEAIPFDVVIRKIGKVKLSERKIIKPQTAKPIKKGKR